MERNSTDMVLYYDKKEKYQKKFDNLEYRMLHGTIEEMQEAQQEFDELFAEYKQFCDDFFKRGVIK